MAEVERPCPCGARADTQLGGTPVPPSFDADPAALAWARGKVERVIADMQRLAALGDARAYVGDEIRAYARWLHRDFVHGGSLPALFDERLPAFPSAIDEDGDQCCQRHHYSCSLGEDGPPMYCCPGCPAK